MTGLAEWLLEAIAADEAAAGMPDPDDDETWRLDDHSGNGWPSISPSRVLAECAAKRAIIAEHAVEVERVSLPPFDAATGEPSPPEWDVDCRICGWVDSDPLGGCPTVKLLAAPYADRPGFREEWRV